MGPPRSPCCAHAVNGQAAAAAPPSSVMTSRRLNRSNCIRSLTIQPDGSVGVYRSVEDESGRIAIRMGAVLWRKAKPRSTAPRRWNAKPSHKPRAIHSFNGSVISGRAARGSAFPRKAACQGPASVILIWSKVANARNSSCRVSPFAQPDGRRSANPLAWTISPPLHPARNAARR